MESLGGGRCRGYVKCPFLRCMVLFFNVVKGLKSGGTRQWKEGYALSLRLHLLHFYLTNLLVSPPAVDSLYFHSSASVITFVLKKNSFHGVEVLYDVSKVVCICVRLGLGRVVGHPPL